MKNKRITKSAQMITCIIFVVTVSLSAVFIELFNKKNTIENYIILGVSIASILVICALTKMKKVSDLLQGYVLVLLSQCCTLLIAYYSGNFYFIPMSLLIVNAVICIYEDLRIGLFVVCVTLWECFMLLVHIITSQQFNATQVALILIVMAAIILSELMTSIILKKVSLYRKVIRENSRSSQDMLKVVEMKRVEAQNAANAKSAFLSNMSHEIRTPINAILGMNEIILRESNESNIIEYSGRIQSASNTLLSLVNDILDFSKIESGKMEINCDNYSVYEMLNDIYNLISIRTEEKGLNLSFDITSSIPKELYGDSLRIKQVIINVLTNAVKYTEKGSVVLKMDWQPVVSGKIDLVINVKDTGIGIKKEDQSRVFNSFERMDSNHTKYIEGTGLGMSITKNLLTMMGGNIYVESEYGVGSVFTIELEQNVVDYNTIGKFMPRSEEGKKTAYKESFIAPKAVILVVDDNEMNLMVVKGLLKNTKIQIDTALSGMQCLDMVKNKKYDIIFMDHMMPVMDGIETFEQMKLMKDNLSIGTPVIALTANAIMGSKDMYIGKGFTDYIAKPIKGYELESVMMRLIPADKIVRTEIRVNESTSSSDSGAIVNRNHGMTNSAMDENLYTEALTMFVKTVPDKMNLLKQYMNERKMKDYCIEIHALKSNSRYIGADTLADIAYELEKASNAFDEKKIIESWELLNEEVNKVIHYIIMNEKIEYTDEIKAETGKIISDENYKSYIEEVVRLLNGFDADGAEGILRDLLTYELDKKKHSTVAKALEMINGFCYTNAINFLEKDNAV